MKNLCHERFKSRKQKRSVRINSYDNDKKIIEWIKGKKAKSRKDEDALLFCIVEELRGRGW